MLSLKTFNYCGNINFQSQDFCGYFNNHGIHKILILKTLGYMVCIVCVHVRACVYACVCVCFTKEYLQLIMKWTHWHTYHSSTTGKLLQSLGLCSTLIIDGSKPVNLFTTAQGLLGAIGSGPGRALGICISFFETNLILESLHVVMK